MWIVPEIFYDQQLYDKQKGTSALFYWQQIDLDQVTAHKTDILQQGPVS